MTRRLAQRSSTISDPRINERIRVPEVRLVGPNGEQVGIVRVEDALRLAAEADLDLVEVAPTAKPPVCKLMDFGKYKYEAAVKARESRKNQVNTVLKEVRFRLKIDKHDYETKTGHAKKFLSQGDKVKAIIQFRGREQQRPELGIKLLQQFAEDVAELGAVESQPRQDGRNMVMVVGPLRTKADARADQRKNSTESHRERQGGGSRRDQAAREAKERAAQKAASDSAPVRNSIGDAFPEQLKAMAARTQENASAAPAETRQAPKTPDPAETKQAPKTPAPAETKQAPRTPAPAASRPAAAAPAAKPATSAKPVSAATPKPRSAATPAAPSSAPKPAAKPMPAPPKPAAPRGGAPKPGPRA
ncbi:translation initiation factor IF-3 [Micrococcus luteus]|uniref:translation initiation factor IF-3 n=1 Tax=Micrococcus luteus TaxID=1270 RepID=UPI0029F2D30B|nr:translation initiation factor IF-3 [Micrococcus luteus]